MTCGEPSGVEGLRCPRCHGRLQRPLALAEHTDDDCIDSLLVRPDDDCIDSLLVRLGAVEAERDAERTRYVLASAGWKETIRQNEEQAEEIARLRDRTEEQAAELLMLREESERPKCMYCAFGEAQTETFEALRHHIEVDCQRHPMAALRAEIARLRAVIQEAAGFGMSSVFDAKGTYTRQKADEWALIQTKLIQELRAGQVEAERERPKPASNTPATEPIDPGPR